MIEFHLHHFFLFTKHLCNKVMCQYFSYHFMKNRNSCNLLQCILFIYIFIFRIWFILMRNPLPPFSFSFSFEKGKFCPLCTFIYCKAVSNICYYVFRIIIIFRCRESMWESLMCVMKYNKKQVMMKDLYPWL